MKILHIEPKRYPAELREKLAVLGAVTYADVTGQGDFITALAAQPYEALFVRLGVMLNEAALDAAPQLRYVVTPTTGHSHLDESELSSRGITLISLKGEQEFLRRIRSTAEHTIGLMLALMRRTCAATQSVVGGAWVREPFLGDEVFERTLGIVGLGRLGALVAEVATALGMRVLYVDVDDAVVARAPANAERVTWDALLPQCDVVSLHLPLEPDTRRFVDAAALRKMKRGAYLVNTARGELVDEAAVLEAVESGQLSGYATDVLDGDAAWADAVPQHHPVVSFAARDPRVIVTPHMGGYGRDSIYGTRGFVIDKLAGHIDAARPPN